MAKRDLRVGILLPGEFRRLVVHSGAIQSWIELGLPRPTRIVGGSAGAIMGATNAPWTFQHVKRVGDVVVNLHYRNIFTVPMGHAIAGILAAGAATFPLWQHFEPELKPRTRFFFHILQTLAGLGLGYVFAKQLMLSKSILSYHPLFGFLLRTMDFKAIFRSDIDVKILMTTLPDGHELVVGTHDEDMTPERLVAAVIGSATVPVYCPVFSFDEHQVTDAEVLTDYPVHHLADMDVVFRFSYSLEPDPYPELKTWGNHFNAMWAITKRENTKKDRREYERLRKERPELPEVIEILTDKPLPRMSMEDFSKDAMVRGRELGMRVIRDNEQVIREGIERARERIV